MVNTVPPEPKCSSTTTGGCCPAWQSQVSIHHEGREEHEDEPGQAARERDARDEEIARLQAKVGEITMDNELLYAKIDKLEGGRPFARRRSKR